jgi:Arc/MetJ-type ribon-helix-helix transcriptional regulator
MGAGGKQPLDKLAAFGYYHRMSSLAIQLPDDLSQFVAASVQSGGYQDADALFVSLLTTFKDQVEAPLSEAESTKLAALRADIQHAVDQADRGEVVQGFDVTSFLAERHREHAARQTS